MHIAYIVPSSMHSEHCVTVEHHGIPSPHTSFADYDGRHTLPLSWLCRQRCVWRYRWPASGPPMAFATVPMRLALCMEFEARVRTAEVGERYVVLVESTRSARAYMAICLILLGGRARRLLFKVCSVWSLARLCDRSGPQFHMCTSRSRQM